jgi:acetate kinase
MNILVINCGSSSIKADILDSKTGSRQVKMRAERLKTAEAVFRIDGQADEACGNADHETVLARVLPLMTDRLKDPISGVGHRVVHGGEHFSQPTLIDEGVEQTIEELISLAPLHNPANLAGIRAARKLFADLPHVAVFDTAFHATLPRRAQRYALPAELADKHGIRRYGFHGTSHAWVANRAAQHLNEDLRSIRVITCHLGNGCSIAAVEYGRSVETSMGMTPLEGLVMGTRSGDVDPGVLIDLMRKENLDADGLDQLLNRQSGLKGLSGIGNDLRDIEERAADGDKRAQLTLHVFTHRLRKYIGAYAAVMGGVDALVFTGGIGQNSALIRHRSAQRLDFLGARLDEAKNRQAKVDHATPVAEISQAHSRVRILAVATDEEHGIAEATARIVGLQHQVAPVLPIPVAISARHIHLTQDAVDALFGKGHELTPHKPLTQPGQFASKEKVNIVGPKRSIEGVRILGPCRSKNQVEISRTDEFHLGIDAPVRGSGDLANTPGCTLIGPAGKLELNEGVICVQRHIHMRPEDAEKLGVKDRDLVEVEMDTEGRDLIFGDVLVRVSEKYALEMHVDTDEGNAAELNTGQSGALVATGRNATIRSRRAEFDR